MRKAAATGLLAAAAGALGARIALRAAGELTHSRSGGAGGGAGVRELMHSQSGGAAAAVRGVGGSAGSGVESGVRGAGAVLLAPDRWNRFNHRGEPVTLLEGPAYAAAAAAAVLLAPAVPGRVRVAGVLAVLGAGALGRSTTTCTGTRTGAGCAGISVPSSTAS